MAFVHLRSHTEFSVVDGTVRIDDLVSAAAKDKQPAVAVTDLSNLFGALKLYKSAQKKGVQPIIGADVWLEPEEAGKAPTRLLLLIQNRKGYLRLCELLGEAWTAPGQRTHAWVHWASLAANNEGLICLSSAEMGLVGQALLMGDVAKAEAQARKLAETFPNRFYIELQRGGHSSNEPYIRDAVPLAARLKLPVVATHPIQFQEPDDFQAHEARTCIAEGETLGNPKRVKRFTRDQHFKTTAEMEALFADIPSAITNTLAIARRCSLTLVLGKPQLPNFPTPIMPSGEPQPMADFFRELSHAGLEERLVHLFPKEAEREAQRPHYVERLDFEINTILNMGFPGYFLIVQDFINWAKNNGCPVGPGRGSGAGSLVAYALKITDLDPLKYNLLFERFLNPERVSMPDFDIDFCQGNRDRVIDYVKDRYGREAVSQIATFGTMAAKAALRDVGRVLGMGYGHVDSIAKLIPAPPGKSVTLARVPAEPDPGIIYARKEAPELEEREKAEEEVASLLELAMRVEGMVRNIGMHAGGVLIAPGKITDFCPLYMQPGSDSAVSQYDKDDVEAIGLVKFDFLGLATLTILELAKDYIVARHPDQKDFDFAKIPLDDAAAYRLLSEGKTVAVFQLESRGMQGMLRDAKPSVFEDIIALVALYRPGPMDLIPSFCARKHGREEVDYPHPLMESVLKETYGIMVYQEQVMQVAQKVGGYSLGGADMLRRAMGKKKVEEMAEHRSIFAAGAAKNDIKPELANEIFDLMEKFAGYGFNKSHAAAYALLAYHTAWLKAHYTAEFFSGNMSVSSDDTDKLKIFHDDATQNFGITFTPPDVNQGEWRFVPTGNKTICYALGAVKGTGQGAIEALVRERKENGPFKSFFDFCARVDRKQVNKRVVEALIKAGAFDSLEPHRAGLLASVGLAFEYADTLVANADQGGLFDFGDSHAASTNEPELVPTEPWTLKERLSLEKTAIGFYLSGHLFDEAESEVRRFAKQRIGDLKDSRDPQVVSGIISELRVINGTRGRVAIFKLDDKSDVIEAVANQDTLDANKDLLKDDELVIITGKVQTDRFSGGLRLNVQQVMSLPAARCRYARFVRVLAKDQKLPVADILREFPARQIEAPQPDLPPTVQGLPIRVVVERRTPDVSARAEVELGDKARMFPSDQALQRFKELMPEGQAMVVYGEG
ncbi:MAG: DNA polymerase III subunit alpha [Aquabacterium sp.]|uniref:DNA polymerase III subunit alpha n=1 Tax=Aquabacterium sp. TaxID=1872578 RepID=UPI0025BFA617|nr:DNA polymerase III subunit alpha [Aquabacterium sp.]MBI3381543.1 DNA polymerase III subunit alpha [Aquabacterium sp.]